MKVIRGRKYIDPDASSSRPFNFEDYLNKERRQEQQDKGKGQDSIKKKDHMTLADLEAAGRKGPNYFFVTKEED